MIAVSDRALVRFLERAGGVNLEALREQLKVSLGRAAGAAAAVGAADYVVKADGLDYVVVNGVVVTVLKDEDKRKRR